MEEHMSSRTWKLMPIVAAFLVMTVFAVVLAISVYESQNQYNPFAPRQIPQIRDDIELYYTIRAVLSTVNIALLVVLFGTYLSIYIKTRSQFTVGLLIFAVVFLIKDVAASPFTMNLFNFGMSGLGPFAFIPDLLELAALSVLLYLSWKY